MVETGRFEGRHWHYRIIIGHRNAEPIIRMLGSWSVRRRRGREELDLAVRVATRQVRKRGKMEGYKLQKLSSIVARAGQKSSYMLCKY